MSDEPLEPLPPELRALWNAERNRPELSAEAQARILRGIASVVPVAAPAPDAPNALAAKTASGLMRKSTAMVLAAFVSGGLVGGGVGAALHARLSHPEPRVVVVERPVEIVRTVAAPVAIPPAVTATAAEAPATSATPPPSHAAPAHADVAPTATTSAAARESDPDVALAAERTAIEIARTALGRHDGGAAIEALQRYDRAFARGRLYEERASLWIVALAMVGRQREANARAASFVRAFPRSVYLPMIHGVVRERPDAGP